MRYFLCLGSNTGDKRKNLELARKLLEKNAVRILQASSVYRTQPVDLVEQPWFYNQVIGVKTNLLPEELLRLIKEIEKKIGRTTGVPKGPRVIDIDILLAGNTIIQTRELALPHPRLEKRNFVLHPLCEISPETFHPILRVKIEDLARTSEDTSIVEKLG